MRIIPARAGFTVDDFLTEISVSDHPRSRGVYMQMYEEAANVEGSSPLARGLLTIHRVELRGNRIIPARAGFTLKVPQIDRVRQDHPRSRGVYYFADSNLQMAKGSSPLARGLLVVLYVLFNIGRIIPARAGFT